MTIVSGGETKRMQAMTRVLFLKANPSAEAVNVKGYVRGGRAVRGHTEVRQVSHDGGGSPALTQFKDVVHSTKGGASIYRRVVADGKPNYQGSGRKIEEITVHADGSVFSKMAHGSTHKHASLGDAAAHLGWSRA